MKGFNKSKNNRTSDIMKSEKVSKKSRNVQRLQEKQIKRGRFTKYL